MGCLKNEFFCAHCRRYKPLDQLGKKKPRYKVCITCVEKITAMNKKTPAERGANK